MKEIKTLIDKASKVCGGDIQLAERMGIHAQTISNMRHGKRTITPETAAELADIAGDSVKAAIYQAMIERAAGTRREHMLKEILGKSLLAGVAAMSLFSYAPEVKAATTYNEKVNQPVNLIYIVEYAIARIKRLLRPALWAIWSHMGGTPHPPRCLSKRQNKQDSIRSVCASPHPARM